MDKRKEKPLNIQRQRLVQNIINNQKTQRYKNLVELMVASGFSRSYANSDGYLIIKDPRIQEQLVKFGFNELTAKAIITEIAFCGEEGNRLKAAQEMFKVHGTYAPEKVEHRGAFYHLLNQIQNNGEDLVTGKRENNSSDNARLGGIGQNSREQIIRTLTEPKMEDKQSVLDSR